MINNLSSFAIVNDLYLCNSSCYSYIHALIYVYWKKEINLFFETMLPDEQELLSFKNPGWHLHCLSVSQVVCVTLCLHCLELMHDSPKSRAVQKKKSYWDKTPSSIVKYLVLKNSVLSVSFFNSCGTGSEAYPPPRNLDSKITWFGEGGHLSNLQYSNLWFAFKNL